MKRLLIIASGALAFALACAGGAGKPIETSSAFAMDGANIYDVAVSGGKAYLADRDNGLRIVDVTDPTAPKELGALEGQAISLLVDGDTVYIGDWSEGLVIVDVSDPAAPKKLSSTKGGSVYYVEKKGNHLLMPGRVWDVSDPANPASAGSLPDGSGGNGALLDGDTLYSAASSSGFYIIDVTDPTNAREIAHGESDYPKDAVVYADHLYLPEYNSRKVAIFDISTPATPTRVGELDAGAVPAGVALSGGTLLVAADSKGVLTFDLADPAAPTPTSGITTASGDSVYKVFVGDQGVFGANKKKGLLMAPLP